MPVASKITKQLSLAARPRTFKDVIGQQKILANIKKMCETTRPKAFLFSGASGAGKTTIAFITALSYQCTHSEEFGSPCADCWANRKNFDIYEIDMAKLTGKSDVSEALNGANYAPFGNSQYRVYILDECHLASKSAMSLLLRMMEEDTPDTTVFMLCTTSPQSVLPTIRTRCKNYQVRDLIYDEVEELVKVLLKRTKSKLDAKVLADALTECQVFSPRFICHAVEKYIAGSPAEEAAMVDTVTEVNTIDLIKAMQGGNWEAVAKYLYSVQTADVRNVRASVTGMLRKHLLDSPEVDEKTKAVARGLDSICSIINADDLTISANLAAQLYMICSNFAKYSR